MADPVQVPVQVIVTLNAGAPAGVRRRLADAGLEIENILDAIGIITGACDAGDLAGLRQVEGVAAVERDTTVDIGPPDAELS